MAKSLIEGLQQKHAEREAKKRTKDCKEAIQYNQKKFNCRVVPYHQMVAGQVSSGWFVEALLVKEKK